jgi:hypothetical protein
MPDESPDSRRGASMTRTSPVTLQLTAAGIDAYCGQLARRLPSPGKRVAAIDALITFLSTQVDTGQQAGPQFRAIREILDRHFEAAREALLDERARRLEQALRGGRVSDIGALYGTVSGGTFRTLLARATGGFDAGTLRSVRAWAADWQERVGAPARQASPYPDSVDFRAAGVDPAQYLAMTDLCRYLGID